MDIQQSLSDLHELKCAAEVARLDYEAKRAEVLRPVADDLAALEAEYAPLMASANERAAALEAEIKAAVVAAGASVKGAELHAVYAKGRVSWDSKKLDGMAVLIPQLAEARTVGAPSVSIRAAK